MRFMEEPRIIYATLELPHPDTAVGSDPSAPSLYRQSALTARQAPPRTAPIERRTTSPWKATVSPRPEAPVADAVTTREEARLPRHVDERADGCDF